MTQEPIPIFPGSGGLNTRSHESLVGDEQSPHVENVAFDHDAIESPGGIKKLHRDIIQRTNLNFAPETIFRTARDLDEAISPWAFIPYHENQEPQTEMQIDISFRLNHKRDDTLTGKDQSATQINAPRGGEFQFQPLMSRGGGPMDQLKWVLGISIVNPEGGLGAAEFIRPVFYYNDVLEGRLKFCAAQFAVRPGVDIHIQLQLGQTAEKSRWLIRQGDGQTVQPNQITNTDLIVPLPSMPELIDLEQNRPLYIARSTYLGPDGYNANRDFLGVQAHSATSWSDFQVVPNPALDAGGNDNYKGYFVRRVEDGAIRQVVNSTETLLTFDPSSWPNPSASDTFDLFPPMEETPQDIVIGEVRMWNKLQHVKPWDYSNPADKVEFLPQIRMQQGDPDAGTSAFFYRSDNGRRHKVRGTHITKDGNFWRLFLEDPNPEKGWDEAEVREVLQDVVRSGQNCLRVLMIGRSQFFGTGQQSLPNEYTKNFANFVKLCTEYGIYVICALELFPLVQDYVDEWDTVEDDLRIVWRDGTVITLPKEETQHNEMLSPGYLKARMLFLREFAEQLKKNLGDERYLSTIHSFQLQNEGNLRTNIEPFRDVDAQNGAIVFNTNVGRPYDMTKDEDRRNMVLENIVKMTNDQVTLMRELFPDSLVGLDCTNQAKRNRFSPNYNYRFDGRHVNSYPLLPYQDTILVDYYSLHIYTDDIPDPNTEFDLTVCARSSEVDQLDKWRRPLIIGEIGMNKEQHPTFGSPEHAILLKAFEDSETSGFEGFLWWSYALGDDSRANQAHWRWNFEQWIQDNTDPVLWPWYSEVPRSETLEWSLMPGRNTSQERSSIADFEALDKESLVGYWPLDDDGGYRLRDWSATANHGWMRSIPFDAQLPGEIYLDGERASIQVDLSDEPDLQGAFQWNLGRGGRMNLCFRATIRLCRDMPDHSEASFENGPYETLISWDDPKSETSDPLFELRWTKWNKVRTFYVVWNTGNSQVVTRIESVDEQNPNQEGDWALGLVPEPGREFTILAGIQTTDGNIGHRVYTWVLNTDNQALGYSTNVSTPEGEVVLNDLKKSRISFGAAVAPSSQGAGSHAAAMIRIRDLAWGLHPVVDTAQLLGDTSQMTLSPYVSPAEIRTVREKIASDAGLISLSKGTSNFDTVDDALVAKDTRFYPRNWVAEIPALETEQRRENDIPYRRPKFVHFRQVTTTGGELSEIWDEEDIAQAGVRLPIWLGYCDFQVDRDPQATNPTPKGGERWALTPLWQDKGALGSVDPTWWNLAILPARTSSPQERFGPFWDRGVVKGFESIRGQSQVDLRTGERHHIAAAQGSLYQQLTRRVKDHPFFGEENPRGGVYEWCVEIQEKPGYLTLRDERRQPDLVSRDRARDPWPRDGVMLTDDTLKWWVPNNISSATYWLMEMWIKIPSLYGKRTLASRVGTEQGSEKLIQQINHHWFLDAGCPEFLMWDEQAEKLIRFYLGSSGKMKMRDLMRPNVWTHLAVTINLGGPPQGEAIRSFGGHGFFVNGKLIGDTRMSFDGIMTVLDIPDNVDRGYLGVFGQDQPGRETEWSFGLGGRMAMARIQHRDVPFEDFTPEKW